LVVPKEKGAKIMKRGKLWGENGKKGSLGSSDVCVFLKGGFWATTAAQIGNGQ